MARLIKENDRLLDGRDIRVISDDGEQLGIIPYAEARQQAKSTGLDLVLVADNVDPPVCRIMDFGKLVYEQKRRQREQKKHQHTQKLKEVKFRLRIDDHDYQYKINHAIEFLGKGNKVKATIMFRGREMAHKELGFELINRILDDLKEHAMPESPPRMLGRNLSATMNPIKSKHR